MILLKLWRREKATKFEKISYLEQVYSMTSKKVESFFKILRPSLKKLFFNTDEKKIYWIIRNYLNILLTLVSNGRDVHQRKAEG